MAEKVAVLGASAKPERYSYKAVKMLSENGHVVYPVHPSRIPIDGVECYANLGEIPEAVDTITVYLGQRNSAPLIDDILASGARRVILNPGAESELVKKRCSEAEMEVLEACTLVLLATDQF